MSIEAAEAGMRPEVSSDKYAEFDAFMSKVGPSITAGTSLAESLSGKGTPGVRCRDLYLKLNELIKADTVAGFKLSLEHLDRLQGLKGEVQKIIDASGTESEEGEMMKMNSTFFKGCLIFLDKAIEDVQKRLG